MKDHLIDVHAMAYGNSGNFEIKLIDSPPSNLDEFAKVVELIDETRQLVLWVPEGTPGDDAQNLATRLVPELRAKYMTVL